MEHTRRTALRLLGGGITVALAGCMAPGNGGTVTDTASTPLAVRGSRPQWHDGDEAVGFSAVIDGDDRAETARSQFALPDERAETVDSFFEETDFESERVLLVETVGPNACFGEVAFTNVALDGDTLDATATATARDADACADVITYPSALLRVTFDGAPVDQADVEIRDGWDGSVVLAASTTTDLTQFATRSE